MYSAYIYQEILGSSGAFGCEEFQCDVPQGSAHYRDITEAAPNGQILCCKLLLIRWHLVQHVPASQIHANENFDEHRVSK